MKDFQRALTPISGSLKIQQRLYLKNVNIDIPTFISILSLAVLSILALYSATERDWGLLNKQIFSFFIGTLLMLTIANLEEHLILRLIPIGYSLGIFFLVLVDFMGHNAMGATRWITIPGVTRFQPSEFMKILIPSIISWHLSRYNLPPSLKVILVAIFLIILPFMLIIRQPDLGTGILVLIGGVFALFIGGLPWKWIAGLSITMIPTTLYMWFFRMHEYQKQRVLTFLDPEKDPLGAGWNIIQSKAALGSGGIFGKGWLSGSQVHLNFLPESHTDFIIAVIGEEFGFFGISILLSIYLFLVIRGISIAKQSKSSFGKILGSSLIMTFFIYIFVNIGMVSGILPVVGVPLPFISYGGSSIVTLMSGFGLLMSIKKNSRKSSIV